MSQVTLCMFIRKKRNPSGITSIQVIDKSSGQYKVVKTIGSSSDPGEIDRYCIAGYEWIKGRIGQAELDFSQEVQNTISLLNGIEEICVSGTEFLLGRIFDDIGFNEIKDELFRRLVLARLCFPASKLKTTDYLSRYQFFDVDVQKVYRYLDKLHKTQKEQVQRISYAHTVQVLQNSISIVFYDVTTLYFEIDSEDDLRKPGFSKEGKHQHPQIILGLLVSIDGYPLAYEVFEGNKFEGHTMLPVIDAFKAKYKLNNLVIVADSGLLSRSNIVELQSKGYQYILGARIKNESKHIRESILSLSLTNGQSEIITKDADCRMIISYSLARAKKDKANRARGIQKLKKQIQSGQLTKAALNNRGYNKFLQLKGEISITMDEYKVKEDERWDGLKGYITNTPLSKDEVIDNYNHLWRIERAFRISKTDLKIRPIYHRLQRRIEAHICIAFAAYKVYKELERQLKEKKAGLSPEKAIEIAKTIYSIKIATPQSKEIIVKHLYLTQEQKQLAKLFEF